MKIFLTLFLIALPAALPAQEFSTANMRSITLEEAYLLTLAKSEALAIRKEGITQLEAAERALKAAFRPTLDITAQQSKYQNAASVSKGYVTGSYTLFSGMRDYISLKAAAAKTQASALDLEQARRQMYLDTARAALNLYEAQREALIRREQLNVTDRRIKELEARVELGRSRKSEAVAARTQLAQDKAAYLEALTAERTAQQALMFLTGLDKDLAPEPLPLREVRPLEEYLSAALQRKDIAAKRKGLEYYSRLLEAEDHNLWPSVTASADYYALRHPMPSPAYHWYGELTATIPLYNGGISDARRQSAYSARQSSVLDIQQAERQALADVRTAYDQLHLGSLKTSSLEEALALAEDNAALQQEDYKMGLVTNLDVLSALNSVQSTRLALAQARVNQVLALLGLENAAGTEIK